MIFLSLITLIRLSRTLMAIGTDRYRLANYNFLVVFYIATLPFIFSKFALEIHAFAIPVTSVSFC